MDVLVPFDAHDPKTRLSPVLDSTERRGFARAMLTDVLGVLREAGHQPHLLSTAEVDCSCPETVDQRPLSAAVNAALSARTGPLAVVMADLALLTTDAVTRLCEPDADIVLAPGMRGGTNAFVRRDSSFRVDYHGLSFQDHCERARTSDMSLSTVDSFRLAVDIDTPADLVELLLHGDGVAAEWLRTTGFSLVETGDGPTARRESFE